MVQLTESAREELQKMVSETDGARVRVFLQGLG